jgi:catechol 2,3-dioxygenase-like lactoylglutathione lyase family enzyme
MRLNNVVIATRDYEAMVDFYSNVTGWPIFFQNRFCTFIGRGKPHLVFHPVGPDTDFIPPEGHLCLDFEVSDIDETADRLELLGYKVTRKPDMIVLRDPVGNLVEITPEVAK